MSLVGWLAVGLVGRSVGRIGRGGRARGGRPIVYMHVYTCIRAPEGTHQLHAAAPALALAGGDKHLLLIKFEEGVLPPVVLLHARLLSFLFWRGID